MNTNQRLTDLAPKAKSFFGHNSILLGCGGLVAIAGVAIVAILAIFFYADGLQREAVQREQSLSARVVQEQVQLSETTLNQMNRMAGFAAGTNALKDVTTSMIEGKFNNRDANGLPVAGQINQALVVNALTEAYPDETGVAIAELTKQLIDGLVADQKAYSNFQKTRFDEVRDFEVWLNSGILRSAILRFAGFPDSNLRVVNGGKTYLGLEALVIMVRPIMSEAAIEAFDTGVQKPVQPVGK